jgi:Uma2 family endonuclease
MTQQIVSPPIERALRIPMSYEEYLAWATEDVRAEWVNGEAIVFMPALTRHVDLTGFFYRLLAAFVDLFGLGRVYPGDLEMRLPSGEARVPDVVVVLREHLGRVSGQRLDGPADLVIELVSEDSVERDRVEKVRAYAAAGIPEYLIVEAREGREGVEVYRLDERGRYRVVAPDARGRYHSRVLAGWWLDPAWLRQEPLPDPEAVLMEIAPEAYFGKIKALYEARRGAEE